MVFADPTDGMAPSGSGKSLISEDRMLRVEASNLPSARGTPRPRRLLPHPPNVKRRLAAAAGREVVPDEGPAAIESTPVHAAPRGNERWSVRLELKDDDIAKLYGQGMTRGAVVWKKGMVEWRPLLVTPELTTLLRRTRTTLTELSSSSLAELTPSPPAAGELSPAFVGDELTLPRPPRVPSDVVALAPSPPVAAPPAAAAAHLSERPRFTTIAPTAIDVEREAPSKRRRIELAAVAVAAFALAWITHGRFSSESSDPVPPPASLAALPTATPACEPATSPPATAAPASTIRTVAVSDLPIAGTRSATSTAPPTTAPRAAAGRAAPTRSSSAAQPTRAELMGALAQVSRAAGSCGERNGPVRVVMSFAPSGVARSIQVSGAGLPAQTRSCIISAASRARVPAFSGEPVTVAKSL